MVLQHGIPAGLRKLELRKAEADSVIRDKAICFASKNDRWEGDLTASRTTNYDSWQKANPTSAQLCGYRS